MKYISKSFYFLIATLSPVSVLAADLGLTKAQGIGLQGDLAGMIAKLITTALGLVGAIALAMIVYGGFLYITAAGDEKQITKGKTVIIYAVIGIIVIGISYALVQFVVGAFVDGGSTSGSSAGAGQTINGK